VKQPFIFSAGRFWDLAKNLATLAAAARRLEWPVGVAGLRHPRGGDDRAEGIEWLGPLSTEEMALAYSAASIYALPALYEPFGLTILEAALSGCALVLGDIPSLREIWGEAACYVAPRDAKCLTATINRLIQDDVGRQEMAGRALRRARQLSARRMADTYFHYYRALTVHHRRPAALQGAR
jgi:glycosyltransferase involved in cell wall biosynthesis